MVVQEIRKIAQGMGIKTGKMSKTELVQSIQRVEGNFDCFGTAYDGVCDQDGCLWREDCFTAARPQRAKTNGSGARAA